MKARLPQAVFFGGRRLKLGKETYILGILNVTPDSFSDGGKFMDPGRALDRALALQAQGALGLDLGGESTRPGARALPVEEERRRVIPVLRRLVRSLSIPISIDSRRLSVQREALDEGAKIINDISGGADPGTFRLAARAKAGLILMHMRGEPGTMQRRPRYRNVLSEVSAFLKERRKRALEAGLPLSRLILDPGIGFGKTLRHNLELLKSIPALRALGSPVLIGASRKSWLGKITGRPVEGRLAGSLAAAALAASLGADFLRVHDVAESLDAARIGRAWAT